MCRIAPQRVGVLTQVRFAMAAAAAAAAQESAFDPPRWLGRLTAQFGAVLDAGSGSGSDWESEDEDVLNHSNCNFVHECIRVSVD